MPIATPILRSLMNKAFLSGNNGYGKDDFLDLESLALAPSGGLVGVGHAWGKS